MFVHGTVPRAHSHGLIIIPNRVISRPRGMLISSAFVAGGPAWTRTPNGEKGLGKKDQIEKVTVCDFTRFGLPPN